MSTPPRAVVLLSGGLDSATCLAIAKADGRECHTLAFDYGQRHKHELAAASHVAKALGAASHRVLDLNLRAFGGSALTADIAVPKDRSHEEMTAGGGATSADIPVTYVPARNLIFLSIATALAETLDAREIYLGVNAIDYSGYPDCRPEFVAAFERTATLATKAGVTIHDQFHDDRPAFAIRAPLVRMTKAQIIETGTRLGVDYGLTHSCYDPVGPLQRACGRCDSCQLRRQGFHEAGVADPTRYAP
jgi:7-cyano-7-deazaguanine synthase